jgi:hypothetical protein
MHIKTKRPGCSISIDDRTEDSLAEAIHEAIERKWIEKE